MVAYEKVKMTSREIVTLVEDYIGTSNGYLNHFTYSKHERFYKFYCDLTIDVPSHRARERTTLGAFVQILKDSSGPDQAKILRGVFAMIPPPEAGGDAFANRRLKAHKELMEVLARLEANGLVQSPNIIHTSATVLEALKDAEALLKSRSPKSAVDRAHTALHGYLKKLCEDRGILFSKDPSITEIFGALRRQLPEFSEAFAHDVEAKRVFGSIGQALDSLNLIRNRGSLAHPNDLLLEEPEAELYINLSRAVLSYVEHKTKKKSPLLTNTPAQGA
jgi:hypothetical protein